MKGSTHSSFISGPWVVAQNDRRGLRDTGIKKNIKQIFGQKEINNGFVAVYLVSKSLPFPAAPENKFVMVTVKHSECGSGSRREILKEKSYKLKNRCKLLKIAILLQFKEKIQLNMRAKTQLSLLMSDDDKSQQGLHK